MESEVLIATPCLENIPSCAVPPAISPGVPVKTCPWGKVKPAEAVSFNDVMSEQLVSSLMEKKEPVAAKIDAAVIKDVKDCGEELNEHSDDYLLAQILQLEFDKEHDEILKREESKFNGDSKVKVTYGKYMRLPCASFSDDEEEEERDYQLEQSAKNHWRNYDEAEKAIQAMCRSGVSSGATTKHNPTLCGRRNAGRMMEFPPCIKTGDGASFDMKFSNRVYNSLKTYSVTENKRRQRVHDKKETSSVESTLDEKTNLILFKLLTNETLESITGCVSTGKEASVYHAWTGMPAEETPAAEFAIKVFRTSCNKFQNRDEYIKDDYRFRCRFSKQNPRKVIHLWAEKEMRNLQRMKEGDIPCPEVVVLKNHVLVMTFIGKDMLPAPKLKDVELPFEDMTIIFEQTLEILKNMYNKCKLVHADFSEYNLLWHDDKTWVIDVSQAVDYSHPRAKEFLLRDCTNVSTFFEKKGVKEVPSPEKLFFEVCGQHPPKDDCISKDN